MISTLSGSEQPGEGGQSHWGVSRRGLRSGHVAGHGSNVQLPLDQGSQLRVRKPEAARLLLQNSVVALYCSTARRLSRCSGRCASIHSPCDTVPRAWFFCLPHVPFVPRASRSSPACSLPLLGTRRSCWHCARIACPSVQTRRLHPPLNKAENVLLRRTYAVLDCSHVDFGVVFCVFHR